MLDGGRRGRPDCLLLNAILTATERTPRRVANRTPRLRSYSRPSPGHLKYCCFLFDELAGCNFQLVKTADVPWRYTKTKSPE